jgi:hypothetical protein
MAITFACEACGKPVRAPVGFLGQETVCPNCGAHVTTPGGPKAATAVKPPPLPPIEQPVPPHSRHRGLWVVGLLVSLVVGIAIGSRAFGPRSELLVVSESHEITPDEEAVLGEKFVGQTVYSLGKRFPGLSDQTYETYQSWTRNEQDCYILYELMYRNEQADAWWVMKGGFAPEFPRVIRLLNKDVGTPVARKVANKLSLLLPLAAVFDIPIRYDDFPSHKAWEAAYNENSRMHQLAFRVNAELKPLSKSLDRDIYRMFYRRSLAASSR